ncbi:hypothetical protein IWW50_002116 [Coemansia erecta]|nr:hypothetical protein IWW50_002116 [Coemansia erecta]
MTEPAYMPSRRMPVSALLNATAVSPRPRHHADMREGPATTTNQLPPLRTVLPCLQTTSREYTRVRSHYEHNSASAMSPAQDSRPASFANIEYGSKMAPWSQEADVGTPSFTTPLGGQPERPTILAPVPGTDGPQQKAFHGWGNFAESNGGTRPEIFVPVQPMREHSALGMDRTDSYIGVSQSDTAELDSEFSHIPTMLMPPPFSAHMSSKISHMSLNYLDPDYFAYGKSSSTQACKTGRKNCVSPMPVSPRNFDYVEDDDETNSETSVVMVQPKKPRIAEPEPVEYTNVKVVLPDHETGTDTIPRLPAPARIAPPCQASPAKSPAISANKACAVTLPANAQKNQNSRPPFTRKPFSTVPAWARTERRTEDTIVVEKPAERPSSREKSVSPTAIADGDSAEAQGAGAEAEDNKPLVDWMELDLSESIWIQAQELYNKVKQHKAVQNRQPVRMKHAILAAIIFLLCRSNNHARTVSQLCKASNTSKHDFNQYLKVMKRELGTKFASLRPATPEAFLGRQCSVLGLPSWVADAAVVVHDRADKMAIVQGRTPPGIYAASIWLVVWCYNHRHSLEAWGFMLPKDTLVTSVCVPNVLGLEKSEPMLECTQQHISDKGSIGIPTMTSVFKCFVPHLNSLIGGLLDEHL